MRIIEVRVPPQMHQELVYLKMDTGVDMSEHIRNAIAEYLAKKRKEKPFV